MRIILNYLFVLVLCLFSACVIKPKPVNLSEQDIQQATQLFYKVLDKKITGAKGKDIQIEIIDAKKDAENNDTMHIDYALDYVLPEKKDEPEAKIQYAAVATLKAFYKKHKLHFEVLKSEQKEYQMDFVNGIIIDANQ
ncbi:hypothetical protein MRY82_01035 [bacterium]|nr:hypothetical protein [bacterium]